MAWGDPAFWMKFFSVIMADLVVAGDNALVIGIAASKLPAHQRTRVITLGCGMAIGLRILLTIVASKLLGIPWVHLFAGVTLFLVAAKLLVTDAGGHDKLKKPSDAGMMSAIRVILIADVVMSLDNVIAVAIAADNDTFLVIFALLLTIPIILWGGHFISRWTDRFPWLNTLGAMVLGGVAGNAILQEPWIRDSLAAGGMRGLWLQVPVCLLSALVPLALGALWRAWKAKPTSASLIPLPAEGAKPKEKSETKP